MNNTQSSKKCAIFVPPHEIKWIGVISRKPMQSFVFHATFKMRGNISQTVVKCHNLIFKRHLGSFRVPCAEWVAHLKATKQKSKDASYLLYYSILFFVYFKQPTQFNMVQTFRNKFQTSEIVTCISVLDYVSKFYLESEAGYIAEKQEINKLTN